MWRVKWETIWNTLNLYEVDKYLNLTIILDKSNR